MCRPRLVILIISIGLTVLSAGIHGQPYPSKSIRIITGGAGGGNDFTSRQIAQGISGSLGQPMIVDNRAAPVAIELASKAPPDGYTLLVLGTSLWLGPLLQKLPYDVMRDFSPITLSERIVNAVGVHPSLPVKSVKELIALAKAKPGELNFGSSAPGGASHLAAELFKSMAGVNIVRVSYKSGAPVMTALLSGEVHMTITDVGLILPYAKTGRLRALAVTSVEPSVLAPGLPTVSASGVPGYESVSMVSVLAPGNTPAAIITRLNQEIVRFLGRAEVKERFLNVGSEIVASTPEQFAATIKSDIAKWGKVIRDAGIKIE